MERYYCNYCKISLVARLVLDEVEVELVENRELVKKLIEIVMFDFVLDTNEVEDVFEEDDERFSVVEARAVEFAPKVTEVSKDELVIKIDEVEGDRVF
jgi:hypothetical protein